MKIHMAEAVKAVEEAGKNGTERMGSWTDQKGRLWRIGEWLYKSKCCNTLSDQSRRNIAYA